MDWICSWPSLFLFKFVVELVGGWDSLITVGGNCLGHVIGVPVVFMGGFVKGIAVGELVLLGRGVGLVCGLTSVFGTL